MTVEEIKVVLRIELEKSFRYIKHIQLRTNLYNSQKVPRQSVIFNIRKKYNFITMGRSQLKQISALRSD